MCNKILIDSVKNKNNTSDLNDYHIFKFLLCDRNIETTSRWNQRSNNEIETEEK